MTNEVIVSEVVQLGTVQASNPQDVIAKAKPVAKALAGIINEQKLFSVISGRKYVRVEGWSTLGAMLGVLPIEVSSEKLENGYEAYVKLVRTSDMATIGGASAICTRDEKNWSKRDEYALKSMAATRATGKAYRLAFSWIINLAGYETTPAEEMITAEFKEKPAQKKEPATVTLEDAENEVGKSDKKRYGDCTDEELSNKTIGIRIWLKNPNNANSPLMDRYLWKQEAIEMIQKSRK